MSVNSTLTMNPFAASKLPYDPQRDFTPISQVTTVPMIWAANDKLPAKTMQEFVTYAKAHPDEVTVGIASIVAQAAVEGFARDWGLKLRLVPYKSGVDITKGLLSGDIQVGFDGAAVYPPHIKAGKLRGLATTGAKAARHVRRQGSDRRGTGPAEDRGSGLVCGDGACRLARADPQQDCRGPQGSDGAARCARQDVRDRHGVRTGPDRTTWSS